MVALGEVGLSGELRSVGQLERRLQEAASLGFKQALVPATLGRGMVRPPEGLALTRVTSLSEAIEEALGR
jgi:DNA repair protein RadA/Sms